MKGTGGAGAHRPAPRSASGAQLELGDGAAGASRPRAWSSASAASPPSTASTSMLREGEVLGLIGPNGSGKTTLFDLISGFIPADAGQVLLGGRRHHQAVARRSGPSSASSAASRTPGCSRASPCSRRSSSPSSSGSRSRAPAARRHRRPAGRGGPSGGCGPGPRSSSSCMGLEAFRDKFVKELSTGLRRIVDLACVLAAEPKVLLLDEPSSGIAQAEAEGLAPAAAPRPVRDRLQHPHHRARHAADLRRVRRAGRPRARHVS